MGLYEREYDEIVHISKSEYEALKQQAREIQARTDNVNEQKTVIKFIDRNNFPKVEDMKRHRVKFHIRKYLPFLVFYSDSEIYHNDDEEFKLTQQYIKDLLAEFVDVIDDEAFAPIFNITPGAWKKLTFEEKVDIFRELVTYYGQNEFDTFVRDLGWRKFMTAYGYTQKDYQTGKSCQPMVNELAHIWDHIQHNEPLL